MFVEWLNGTGLFRTLSFEDTKKDRPGTDEALWNGCPTMVKDGSKVAFGHEAFTAWVRGLELPKTVHKIRPRHLPIFAKVQMMADEMFRKDRW